MNRTEVIETIRRVAGEPKPTLTAAVMPDPDEPGLYRVAERHDRLLSDDLIARWVPSTANYNAHWRTVGGRIDGDNRIPDGIIVKWEGPLIPVRDLRAAADALEHAGTAFSGFPDVRAGLPGASLGAVDAISGEQFAAELKAKCEAKELPDEPGVWYRDRVPGQTPTADIIVRQRDFDSDDLIWAGFYGLNLGDIDDLPPGGWTKAAPDLAQLRAEVERLKIENDGYRAGFDTQEQESRDLREENDCLRRKLAAAANQPAAPAKEGECGCVECSEARDAGSSRRRMIVCGICGNKRCPHAKSHHNACTGSNEPGQEASR